MRRLKLVLAFALFISAPILHAEEGSESIVVSGTGEINVSPDIAYVSFGIETLDKNAGASQQKNAQISTQVERILKERFKLEKSDIKTSGYSVYPDYNYVQVGNTSKRELIGYRVTNTMQVSFRALDKIGSLLDAVGGAGVNNVQGIQFDTEKRLDYEIDALRSAMENAKKKADTIAKAAGRPVKKVLVVDEARNWGGGGPIPPRPMMKAMSMHAEAADASTSVSAGSLKITTNVTVQYGF